MNLDELVVELSLDTKKFTQGQKDALDSFRKTDEEMQKRLSNLEAANKNVGYSFGDTTNAAKGLFEVLLGTGMANFAKDTISSVAATGRAAVNIGIMTSELQALGKVLERNGGNAETANASLMAYASTIQDWKMGKANNDFLKGAKQIGANILSDNPIDVIEKLAKFAETHNAQQTNQTGRWLGMSPDIINSIINGTAKFNKEYAESLKLVASPEQVKKLTDAQNAWTHLWDAIKSVGSDVVSTLVTPFNGVVESIAKWTAENRKLADLLGTVLAILSAIGASSGLAKLAGFIGAKSLAGKLSLPSRLLKGGGVGGMALGVAETMKYDSQHGNELRTMLRHAFGIEDPGEAAPWEGALPGGGASPSTSTAAATGGRDSAAVREARIRMLAAMPDSKGRWIDPDIAMRVRMVRELDNFLSSIPGEQSFGDFQLNMSKRGTSLGDQFLRETGKDPRDPRNEAAGDKWILDWVRQTDGTRTDTACTEPLITGSGIGGHPYRTRHNQRCHNIHQSARARQTTAQAMNDYAKSIANNANTGQTKQ